MKSEATRQLIPEEFRPREALHINVFVEMDEDSKSYVKVIQESEFALEVNRKMVEAYRKDEGVKGISRVKNYFAYKNALDAANRSWECLKESVKNSHVTTLSSLYENLAARREINLTDRNIVFNPQKVSKFFSFLRSSRRRLHFKKVSPTQNSRALFCSFIL